MLFNSLSFAVFFITVFAVYWLLHRSYRSQNLFLLVASYFFYGCWDVRFLVLLALSTVIAYSCALSVDKGRISGKQRLQASAFLVLTAVCFLVVQWNAVTIGVEGWRARVVIDWGRLFSAGSQYWWMVSGVLLITVLANAIYPLTYLLRMPARRKLFLFCSVFANLGILGVFKYYNFFIDNFVHLATIVFGTTPSIGTLNVVLPVGISFYTFLTMSYTIDVYLGKTEAARSLFEIAAYVSFFPLLLAGPIERGERLLSQFQRPRTVDSSALREGLWLIVWGLYQKMVVADNIAKIVKSSFAPFDGASAAAAIPEDGMRLLMTIYAFAIQIYCDFSGYSDIARGTARLLGFEVMVNFNLPYFAKSPADFWHRWHISFSTWLRDYLYIPLGGNRHGPSKTCRNLMITMLLGGLWHGAAWTFVLWGAFHGAILAIYRLFTLWPNKRLSVGLVAVVKVIVTFHLVCFGWLIFRAKNLTTIGVFLQSIFMHPHWSPDAAACVKTLIFYSWFLLLFQALQGLTGTLNPMARLPWVIRLNVWLFVLMSVLSLSDKGAREFIYFAF